MLLIILIGAFLSYARPEPWRIAECADPEFEVHHPRPIGPRR